MGFGDQLAGASCWGGPTARVGGGVVPLSFTSPPLSSSLQKQGRWMKKGSFGFQM